MDYKHHSADILVRIYVLLGRELTICPNRHVNINEREKIVKEIRRRDLNMIEEIDKVTSFFFKEYNMVTYADKFRRIQERLKCELDEFNDMQSQDMNRYGRTMMKSASDAAMAILKIANEGENKVTVIISKEA